MDLLIVIILFILIGLVIFSLVKMIIYNNSTKPVQKKVLNSGPIKHFKENFNRVDFEFNLNLKDSQNANIDLTLGPEITQVNTILDKKENLSRPVINITKDSIGTFITILDKKMFSFSNVFREDSQLEVLNLDDNQNQKFDISLYNNNGLLFINLLISGIDITGKTIIIDKQIKTNIPWNPSSWGVFKVSGTDNVTGDLVTNFSLVIRNLTDDKKKPHIIWITSLSIFFLILTIILGTNQDDDALNSPSFIICYVIALVFAITSLILSMRKRNIKTSDKTVFDPNSTTLEIIPDELTIDNSQLQTNVDELEKQVSQLESNLKDCQNPPEPGSQLANRQLKLMHQLRPVESLKEKRVIPRTVNRDSSFTKLFS